MLKSQLTAAAVLASLQFGSFLSTAHAAGPFLNAANGHKYYSLLAATFSDAENGAVALGGHLVTVNDAAENQWLCDTFAPTISANVFGFKPALIGLNDIASEGSPVWVSGQTSSFFAPIDPTYPNTAANDVVQIELVSATFNSPPFPILSNVAGNWQWAPATVTSGNYVALVEVVPEPASLGMLSAAALACLTRRRR